MTFDEDDLTQQDQVFLRLIAEDSESVPGRLWLQKEIFQLVKSIPELGELEEYLDFQAHLQGPFSEEAEAMEERLDSLGLIQKNSSGKISITAKGRDIDDKIKDDMPDNIQDVISDVKEFMNDLSKEELLAYVYYTYPQMTSESVEKEGIDQRREDIARELYERGKVSQEKASELAGMTLSEFKGYINDQTSD